MTADEFVQQMRMIADRGGGDTEGDHVEADRLLVEAVTTLGGDEWKAGLTYYEEIGKWYA
jgi:hypothetical protein